MCLQKHNIHLVIHYDPVVTDDAQLVDTRDFVAQHLRQRDARLSLHDFRMVRGKGHTNVIFDIALPNDLKGQEKIIKKGIETALAEHYQGTYYAVITFDPEAFN